jgi:hypothetical protein
MTHLVIYSKYNIDQFLSYIWDNSQHYPSESNSVKYATTFDSFTKLIPSSIKWIKKDMGVMYLYMNDYKDGDEFKHIYPHYTIPFDERRSIHYTPSKNQNIYDISRWPKDGIFNWLYNLKYFSYENIPDYYNKYLKYKTKYETLIHSHKILLY